MSGNSSVGDSAVYEADDQRKYSEAEIQEAQRNDEHPAQTELRDKMGENVSLKPSEDELAKSNPVAPAKMHGNQPSRGAQIDAELQKEDEERLRQKGQK